ncbi:Squalene/phytoene synthase [Parasponia andersonii]|uniref:Squalene/phytoene synthase n=1 Tax=Parasponia andersonii TaxID=3476 RepID=A0A2P5CK80_PARAD|nr:Squalene/phytoene synthase [Parasponia andersonii]
MEIEEAPKHIYATNHGCHDDYGQDLCDVSLDFRILRQHRFYVPCDVFNKFKDNFQEGLVSDIQGMLSLYEASHCGLHGEEILDQALVFTTSHLKSMATQTSNISLAEQISCALMRPLQKSLERLHARHYMSIYEDETSHNKDLLELSKLDFNLLQSMHKKELSEISRYIFYVLKPTIKKKNKFEQERIHVASSVECYIKQYGVTEEEVRDVFNKLVENAWKDINQEFLRPTTAPRPILMRVLNFARVMDLIYKEDDGYTRVGKVTRDGVAALLINSVPL